MRAVRERATAAGWDACVVVELRKGHEEPVERVMRPGPSTFRPYVSIDDINKFMMAHDLPNCPITTSDGRLVGLIRRDDVARATPP